MKELFTFPLTRHLAVLVFLLTFSTLKAQTGLINDDFSTGNAYNWAAASLGSTSQVQNGKLVVTYPPPSGGKYRADLKKNGGVVFHAGTYPIIAIKMNKPPRCNYFFDTNLGSFNATNNNGTKIVTESGNVYYWDLSTGKLGTTVLSRTEPTTLSAFQLKVADIVLTDEEIAANKTNYQVEWVKSFASVDALRSFLNPSGTGNPVFEFSGAFSHPGLLHNASDLNRIKDLVSRKIARPYQSYQKLISSDKASATYQMRGPYSAITRDQTLTIDGVGGGAVKNNVESDFLAAYYNALQYTITGNQAHVLKATQIIDAYSAKTTSVIGADKELNGLYGFILANAAEIVRATYPAWPSDKVQQCQNMLKSVFYPIVQNFRPCGHGNWDIICMKALMGIAIFSDDVAMFNKAVNYFYYGEGNGSIKNYVLTEAGQLQESNRDQPHTMLALGSLAELAEMALKQGVDLYSANNNAILRGYEYTAKYNLGFDVPYQTSYDYCEVNYQDYTPASISDKGRGELRPVFEIAYNHYVFRKGLSMPQTLSVLGVTGPEGAPAGADNPGYGSLFFYLNSEQDYSYPNAGLINDDFTATAGLWKTATAGSVATVENGELKVTTVMQSNGKGRGDIQNGVTALHPGNYPILAVKMKKPATCNFIFDTNLGSYGNGANKWTGKVGEDIYYYDLTKTGFGSSGTIIPASSSTSFSVFQFKVADIASGESSYTVDWVKTVKTLADLVALDPNTGLINDNFTSTVDGWNAVTSGASVTVDKGNLRVKLAKQTNGSYRGDIRRTAGATLYPENYPIVAVKLKKPVVANITFDTNLGSLGNGSNKWTGKVGEDIYYFDLTKSGFGTGGVLTRPTTLTTFQFKVADITSGELDYQVDWVKTVKTIAELQQFIAPAYQRIAFSPLDSMPIDQPDFSPAVASSGLPVIYSSSDTSVATIVDGKVHITGGGRTIITAIQPGNAGYYAADPVFRELNVFVPPLILTKNARLELDETGLAVLNPAHVDSGSISYSGLLHLQLNRTSFSCADIGTEVPVLLTGTDEKGHSRSATAKVKVVDRIAPRLQIPEDQTFCYNQAGYSLSLLQATDNCGIDSVWYRISGATERSGSNADASGIFNPGVSTIEWQVKDLSGNLSAGTTKVTINSPLSVSIPDVYAINPAVDEKNTLYLGYGPGSFSLNAVIQGGTAPYTYSWSNGLLSPSVVADSEGTYSVTITDAKGCQSTASLVVRVLDVRCGNNNDKVLICHNANAICVSSSSVNGHLSHGDRLGSCFNSNQLATVSESKVRGDVKKGSVLIYPNPTTNSLFIKGNELGSGARIKIFDLSGKEILSISINNEGRSVDVGSWANGAYVVRIINGREVLTSKFIKN